MVALLGIAEDCQLARISEPKVDDDRNANIVPVRNIVVSHSLCFGQTLLVLLQPFVNGFFDAELSYGD